MREFEGSSFRHSRVSGPKIFQDAVALTGAICMNDLGIDSSCIIQNKIEDRAKESENMGTIRE
jgi:hypothetical protein